MRSPLLFLSIALAAQAEPSSYRHFRVEDNGNRVAALTPLPDTKPPRWARDVDPEPYPWPKAKSAPSFTGPVPFVLPPADPGEPFHSHNHQPSITWLANGDLLAIWYSTKEETGGELTVLASRLRKGSDRWDPSSEFFKADGRNMHGSSIFHDGKGILHHLNGMAPAGAKGWAKLALLHRESRDHGVTWSAPVAVGPDYEQRHQVMFTRADGSRFTGHGLFAAISDDDGKTWPVRKLVTPGSGNFDGGAWTRKFTAAPDNAEHAGYLASTQSPDGTIHLISSRLHYRFNLEWLKQPAP